MTIWKPDTTLSERTIALIAEILAGRPAPTNSVINNGVRDVPSYLLAPTAVDRNNMENTIIAAGYFPRDEIMAFAE